MKNPQRIRVPWFLPQWNVDRTVKELAKTKYFQTISPNNIETKLSNCWVAWTSRWWQGKDCVWAGFHDLGSRASCRIWAHWVFCISIILSDQDPPVMGTYRCLLLGVVPVCAVKCRVVGEGKKTTLWGFQVEWELKRHCLVDIKSMASAPTIQNRKPWHKYPVGDFQSIQIGGRWYTIW